MVRLYISEHISSQLPILYFKIIVFTIDQQLDLIFRSYFSILFFDIIFRSYFLILFFDLIFRSYYFRVVVFASLFEHHSNLLPWRESGAEVVLIDEREDGSVDVEHLERELFRVSSLDRELARSPNLEKELVRSPNLGFKMIGSFCAASNITGQLNDDLVCVFLKIIEYKNVK